MGKTSFVVRYVRNTFHQGNASTIGASFLAKKVVVDDDTIVRLQIWDTAGQERFRSMAPMYYRSAHCGILCYDITSRSSFDVMDSWLHELQNNPLVDDDIMIHIVGTKLDLVDEDPSRRQVNFEDCVAFAVRYLTKRQRRRRSASRRQREQIQQIAPLRHGHHRYSDHDIDIGTEPHPRSYSIASMGDDQGDPNDWAASTDSRLKPQRSKSISTSKLLNVPPRSSNFRSRRHTFSNQIALQQQNNNTNTTTNLASSSSSSSQHTSPPPNGLAPGSRRNSDFHYETTPEEDYYESDTDHIDESELDFAMSCCHEISAKDNSGVEEVFNVITRRLVESSRRKMLLQRYEQEREEEEEALQRKVDLASQGQPGGSSCC